MRRALISVGMVAAACAGVLYGCGETSFGTCADNGTCPSMGADATTSDVNVGEGGGLQETSPSGEGGEDGGALDAAADANDGFTCVATADPEGEPCLVSSTYGVFVAAGTVG